RSTLHVNSGQRTLHSFPSRRSSDLCAGIIHKGNAGMLVADNAAPELTDAFRAAAPSIADAYESRDFARAMREIMALADRANAWIDRKSTRLNSSHVKISYAVFCLKK